MGAFEVFWPLVSFAGGQKCVVGAQREAFACVVGMAASGGRSLGSDPAIPREQAKTPLSCLTDLKLPFWCSVPKSFPSQTQGFSFKGKTWNEERLEVKSTQGQARNCYPKGVGKKPNHLSFLSTDKH